jgi:ATP-dependent Lon protease
VKEKLLAAHRAGLTTVLLPTENQRDLVDVPPQVRDELRIMFVEHMDEVLQHALLPGVVVEEVQLSAAG